MVEIGKNGKFNIKEVKAREILDCRGNPTVEVDIVTEGNVLGRADAPAGRSRGKYEAIEIRDNNSRYMGKGVSKALKNINEIIAPALIGKDVRNQREIDGILIELDGTENKSKLGGNATTATSLAVAKAAANALFLPLYKYIGGLNAHILPVPMLILIAGGKLAATDLDFQEFNIMPIGARSFSEAIRIGTEVYFELGKLLAEKYSKYALNVGDEGSYAPPGLKDPRDAFEIILKAIEELGYEDVCIFAMDAAASQLYDEKSGKYHLMGKMVDREELLEIYEELVKTFPLRSIEDPFHEDDFEGFAEITRTLNIQIVGDDFFATNIKRLKRGVELGAANALLLKVNQVGTLTEALEAAFFALRHGYNVIVSERSGQTEDTWLADLSVAINSGQLKNGAPCRAERTSQFNQLLRIEEELGKEAEYAGEKHIRYIS